VLISCASGGTVKFYDSGLGTSGPTLEIYNLHTGPVAIKALNTVQDQWNTSVTTQTIGGVANCPVAIDWRLTPDYVLDVRVLIGNCPAPPVGATVALPAAMPAVDYSPSVGPRGPYGLLLGAGGLGLTPIIARLEHTPNQISMFLNGNPNNNVQFEGSFCVTLPKP
jgi:hypothetical protein